MEATGIGTGGMTLPRLGVEERHVGYRKELSKKEKDHSGGNAGNSGRIAVGR
jgi:hypothetical protein